MSAQRKTLRKRKKSRHQPAKSLLFLLASVAVLLIFFFFRTKYWGLGSKFSIAIKTKNDDVILAVFDKELEEVTRIIIPGSTQVEVSRQLGTWKIGAVWQLGENESLGGLLLAETITKHFKLPVVIWADYPAEGFLQSSPWAFIKAVVFPYKTNMLVGDKINLGLFSARVKKFKRISVNLSKTPYLKKTTLIDGNEGYLLAGELPLNLIALFSDKEVVRSGLRVVISDLTGKYGLAEQIGEIIEVLGAKVVAIRKGNSSDFDCEIIGSEEQIVKKFAVLFSCQENIKADSFDLEVRLGENFAKRF